MMQFGAAEVSKSSIMVDNERIIRDTEHCLGSGTPLNIKCRGEYYYGSSVKNGWEGAGVDAED